MQKYRLLVIEEEDGLRKQILQHFAFNFEVVTVRDAATGIHYAILCEPDLIIIDVHNRMEEADLCMRVKMLTQLKNIPIIALRTNPTDTEVEAIIRFRIDSVLLKPVSMPILEDDVYRLLLGIPASAKNINIYDIRGYE
jgi:DNA-binding response OmpR family regulator